MSERGVGTARWWSHPSWWISPLGAVGSTGNVILKVRPGGGDPVDPYALFIVHSITP
jgi:hypothetical protein